MIANQNKEKNKVWISRTKQFGERYATPNMHRSNLTPDNPNKKYEDYSFVVAWQMYEEEEEEQWVVR